MRWWWPLMMATRIVTCQSQGADHRWEGAGVHKQSRLRCWYLLVFSLGTHWPLGAVQVTGAGPRAPPSQRMMGNCLFDEKIGETKHGVHEWMVWLSTWSWSVALLQTSWSHSKIQMSSGLIHFSPRLMYKLHYRPSFSLLGDNVVFNVM